ncbi:cell division protein FtsW [Candidatus Woesebacteria bacterium]|nr:cell division protein FtsW [Candidatus Woesebacteria bacterium]
MYSLSRARPLVNKFDGVTLFFMVLVFIAFGVLMVYNVSVVESFITFGDKFYFVKQQLIWAAVAITALIVSSKVPTKVWYILGPLVFIAGLMLLIGVLIPGIGVKVLGARRWISIAGFSFQPVEVMKFGLVFYLSKWLSKERRFLSFLMLIVPIFGLVMLQPDLGSGLILLSIAASMYIVSGKPFKHILWMLGGGIIGIGLLVVLSPYRLQRLTTYLNPESDPLGKSYHIRQITIALGNGGLFGQGLGKSKQKYRYIPEATTDSIFAIIAEELGFVLCGIIIIGYIVLLTKMRLWIRRVEFSPTAYLIGVGMISWIAAQVLVNLSSIVALIPLTGVPLPFISYGGTALVMCTVAIGIVIGLTPIDEEKKPSSRPSRSLRHL